MSQEELKDIFTEAYMDVDECMLDDKIVGCSHSG